MYSKQNHIRTVKTKIKAIHHPISQRIAAVMLVAIVCLFFFSSETFACTGVYAGKNTTANGSIYMGRSEDYGPNYGKQFVIVPAADHKDGEKFVDDYGFSVPYPSHTLRYSAVMDDPSEYDGLTIIPFGEAGINEKGVSVTATVSTYFNENALATDPLTANGLTELSMASYILQSAETALDGVRILAKCIDTYGHGNSDVGNPDYREVSTVMISDQKETWVFEIVSGHQYAATRLSDDTVSLLPNAIMTQQINITDENIIASPGLISTAIEGGFYVTDVEGKNEINVAKSYSEGYNDLASYRFYYAAYILNRALADETDVVPKPIAEVSDLYPYASVEEGAVGPFCLEYEPSADCKGTIDLMTLRQVFASHGEGTAYETTSKNENKDGVLMRSIGTYRQNEEHIFEVRRDSSVPVSVCTIEWLAMAPSEFSVYVPFYTAAMTETPDAYTTETPDDFDPESIYWLFNEIGNAGNGSYYRLDDNGVYHDRYGNEIDAETAEAVLAYLSDSAFIKGLHEYMDSVQEEINTKAAASDEMIIALAHTASNEEVSAIANKLARENADYIKGIASGKLAEIDEMVETHIDSMKNQQFTWQGVILPAAVLVFVIIAVITVVHVLKKKKYFIS